MALTSGESNRRDAPNGVYLAPAVLKVGYVGPRDLDVRADGGGMYCRLIGWYDLHHQRAALRRVVTLIQQAPITPIRQKADMQVAIRRVQNEDDAPDGADAVGAHGEPAGIVDPRERIAGTANRRWNV